MPCYHKMLAVKEERPDGTSKMRILKKSLYKDVPEEIMKDYMYLLNCGQCIGCRLEKSRQWAIRCVHEAMLYVDNCFITLTFNEENIQKNKSLKKSDFQKFMKRLRKKYSPKKIRFFHCGEYGDKLDRPHHHACLFNHDFNDKILYTSENNIRLYRSETLDKLWGKGYCTIGDVTFESAAYVARYVTKKINGTKAEGHYKDRIPEYVTMSRNSGLGKGWFLKYKNDVFPQDNIIIRGGIKCKPPKYYDKQYELTDPKKYEIIKQIRERSAKNSEHNTVARLKDRELVKLSRTKLLKRGYENGKTNFFTV